MSFRIITLKQIHSQICPGDWLFSLDLKDAYFHIQIAPHHRRFLRFAFEGVSYQYTVLPIGLSLAPQPFMKCMDAAISQLRQLGIRILNYLNDWLILAQSEDELLYHRSMLLRMPRTQGQFCQECTVPQPMNFVPGNSYRLSPNEGCDHARTCTGYSAACGFIQTLSPSPPQSVSEDAWPHGLSIFGTSVGPASHAAPSVLAETSNSSTCLASRTPPYQGEPGQHCSSGPLEGPSVDGTGRAPGHGLQKEGGLDRRCQLRLGGGAVRRQNGLRPLVEERSCLHINCLEILEVWLGLRTFLPDLRGHHILVRSDSMTVVTYINSQGGLSLRRLFTLAERLLRWAQLNFHSLRAAHVPGKLNLRADMLSRSNVPSD